MRLIRIVVSTLILVTGSALASGCSTPEVGAPCIPEQIPDNGFNRSEAYVETSSVQCETRVCLVYQLEGDPSDDCTVSKECTDADPADCVSRKCAEEKDVEARIYCSCRCKAPSADFAQCECPTGYACKEILEEGGPGVQGSYCVNATTLNN